MLALLSVAFSFHGTSNHNGTKEVLLQKQLQHFCRVERAVSNEYKHVAKQQTNHCRIKESIKPNELIPQLITTRLS